MFRDLFRRKTMRLDTALFMQRNGDKSLLTARDLLSTMNCENLTKMDIRRLAEFAGLPVKDFEREFCVKV